MLFTITTIRINHQTRVFENTEINQFILLGDIEKELINNGCDFSQWEKVLAMQKGDTITCESTIYTGLNQGTRFSYIHRIS
jgi:hypothetical protein